LAQLREDAERGRNVRRDALLADAINTGRIPPSSRATWSTLLDTDPVNTERTLAGLKPGTIPVSPIGYGNADDERSSLDAVYSELYGQTPH
jgi:hypothetical protein